MDLGKRCGFLLGQGAGCEAKEDGGALRGCSHGAGNPNCPWGW